tara:strand:- start:1088 stop:2509 length:1422 start_codon:yes stop_codon:yes gene_type:complete
VALSISACGGGSSSPTTTAPTADQPTPVTAVGKLTGFGSVYVNGVEYETGSTTYEIDDVQGSGDSDLTVGMIVRVKGSVNADGATGTANSVSYDDDIEGPVENLMVDATDASIKTFTVFGTSIIVNSQTVFDAEDDPAFGFDTLMDGDNVEVSGEYQGDTLYASYVEKQDAADNDFEVKGTVSSVNGDKFVLTLANGRIITVTIAPGASIPNAGVMDGQYVEVEGTVPDPVNEPDSLLATKVELEDEDHFDSNDDEAEIKGPLTFDAAASTWSINVTTIEFSSDTRYEPQSLADAIADGSADGRVVEVEGQYVNGILKVDKAEDESDEIEFHAIADTVTATDAKNGVITLGFGVPTTTLDIAVNGTTMFKDDDATTPFDLRNLANGTHVEISARRDTAGGLLASKLEVDDDIGIKIEGMLDAIDDVSVTVVGVTFSTDPTITAFPDGMPAPGDYVSVEDDNEDGIVDTVEVDD